MQLPSDEILDALKRRKPGPHEPIGECSKCGIKLYRIMGYYCPREDCPCGLGSGFTMKETGGSDA